MKNKTELLNYSQLCKKFNEQPKPKGNRRMTQFKRWKKDWSIRKLNGKNIYEVKRLNIQNVSLSNTRLLSEMILDYLSSHEYLECSTSEKCLEFGLVNDNFLQLTDNRIEEIAYQLQVNARQLKDFKREITTINKECLSRACKKIHINKKKIFIVEYTDDIVTANKIRQLSDIEIEEYEALRNNLTFQKTNGKINNFYFVKSEKQKSEIQSETNQYFGLKYCMEYERWWLDNQDKKSIIDIEYYNENREIANNNSCNKIKISRRGKLKNIDSYHIQIMIDTFIKLNAERI
jgi:hypothetical protein